MPKLFSFDADETLEISRGPIKIQDLRDLHDAGHIVGIVGNWGLVVQVIPDWHRFVSFVSCSIQATDAVGNVYGDKGWFLTELSKYIRADGYYHVGNVFGATNKLGVVCGSHDKEAVEKAGSPWVFVKEDDWVLGDYV